MKIYKVNILSNLIFFISKEMNTKEKKKEKGHKEKMKRKKKKVIGKKREKRKRKWGKGRQWRKNKSEFYKMLEKLNGKMDIIANDISQLRKEVRDL